MIILKGNKMTLMMIMTMMIMTVKQFAPRTKPETIRADIDALLPAAVR